MAVTALTEKEIRALRDIFEGNALAVGKALRERLLYLELVEFKGRDLFLTPSGKQRLGGAKGR